MLLLSIWRLQENEVLLHVSELAWERTENVSDVVNMGDVFDVKYFGVDKRTRKEKVSRKAILPKPEGFVGNALLVSVMTEAETTVIEIIEIEATTEIEIKTHLIR